MAMTWGQGELFPKANKAEIQRTKFLLGKYKEMTMLMQDFEKFQQDLKQVAIDGEAARRIDQEDLHADKTANATILIEKQRWVYKQYKFYTQQLQRAFGLIQDEDERKLSVTGTCRATLTRRRCFSSGMVLVTVQFGEYREHGQHA
ncbi:hypothetical protein [Paenibacillus sp. cl141a]|uniref:hypothetical protein n=1 Tax=Paenibacillus sp. cl141a TaxID=1761877 RepID=UPI0020C845B7|nr:hypothetical protein [Paenibacillus sp. cl141a]